MKETKGAAEGAVQAEWKLWCKERGESLLFFSVILCTSVVCWLRETGLGLLCFVKPHE